MQMLLNLSKYIQFSRIGSSNWDDKGGIRERLYGITLRLDLSDTKVKSHSTRQL